MHAGRHYSLGTVLYWTRRDILLFTLIAAVPVSINEFVVPLPPLPWQPVAMLGTAVAFMTGA
ncbi:MAG: multidrug transporter, partial [Proteobacteria bacterium]